MCQYPGTDHMGCLPEGGSLLKPLPVFLSLLPACHDVGSVALPHALAAMMLRYMQGPQWCSESTMK